MMNRTVRHTTVAVALIALVAITASSAAAFAKHRAPTSTVTVATAARLVSGDLGEVVVRAGTQAAANATRL